MWDNVRRLQVDMCLISQAHPSTCVKVAATKLAEHIVLLYTGDSAPSVPGKRMPTHGRRRACEDCARRYNNTSAAASVKPVVTAAAAWLARRAHQGVNLNGRGVVGSSASTAVCRSGLRSDASVGSPRRHRRSTLAAAAHCGVESVSRVLATGGRAVCGHGHVHVRLSTAFQHVGPIFLQALGRTALSRARRWDSGTPSLQRSFLFGWALPGARPGRELRYVTAATEIVRRPDFPHRNSPVRLAVAAPSLKGFQKTMH
jgi:hypothetical protein